jgi:YHS domain-containing protein
MGAALPLAGLAGCASSPVANHSAPSTQPHAECLVCKKNADLACVDVEVDKDTPYVEYQGKTYHFCSNDCRDKFAKDPAKYVSK